MKRTTRKAKGTLDQRGSNIFKGPGLDRAEADVMLMRIDLLSSVGKQLQAKGWTKREAAKYLGITQSNVAKLLQGTWKDFSVDDLLTLAHRAGLRTSLKVS